MRDDADDLAALISDVRHDANNSLMAILGYLEMLLARDDLPETVMTKLRHIQSESYKIRDQMARTSFIRPPGD